VKLGDLTTEAEPSDFTGESTSPEDEAPLTAE